MTTAAPTAVAGGLGLRTGAVDLRRGLTAARVADDWPLTARPLPWTLALFMAMIWLIPFDSVSLPVSLPLDAKLDRPLLVLIAALWLLSLASVEGESRLRLSPVHWAFFGLVVVAMLSLVLNGPTLTMLGDFDPAVRKLALLFSYVMLFVIVASTVRPTEVRNLVIFMLGLACVTAVGTLVEYRTGYNAFFSFVETLLTVNHPVELGAVDSIGRKSIVGPTVHPLAVASMLAITFPFALVRVHLTKERRARLLYMAAAGLMISAAIATQRKTSVVAPAVGLLVLLAYRPRAALQLIPVAVLLVGVIHLTAPEALGSVKDQLLPQNLFGVLSTKDRQSDYSAVTPDIVKHPAIGRGFESYDQRKYRILDNQYLSLIIGVGVIGIAAYLAIFMAVLLLAHRLARSKDLARAGFGIAVAGAMASAVVGGFLLETFALPQLAYLICFLAGLVVVSAGAAGRANPSAFSPRWSE